MGIFDNLIRAHEHRGPFDILGRAAERYLRAWYNEDYYDFERNGEARALRKFRQWYRGDHLLVWDVGAHHGEWATLAHQALADAKIISFEMIPQTYQALQSAMAGKNWSRTVASGLSDSSGVFTACFNAKHDTTSALTPRLGNSLYPAESLSSVDCTLIKGDEFYPETGVPQVLKIDTEGHEVRVLKGCLEMLRSESAPEMIQFEYGQTYIPSGSTLHQIYELLEPLGYKIGRLYPNRVKFRAYDYASDNFRMGNFIAVRSAELAQALG